MTPLAVDELRRAVERAGDRVVTDARERGQGDVAFLKLLNAYRKAVREHALAQAMAGIQNLHL